MGKTILVIDDDLGLVHLLEKGLGKQGYEVLIASTGEEGLQLAQEKSVDLILLDVIMPKMKGREVCKRLKEDERTKQIPVVFLTAKNSPDDLQAEIAAGAVAHITKPVDLNALMPKIVDVLEKTQNF
jgi:CheY-like chemotaxis protein